MKACTKCHAVKTLDDFYNDRSYKGGKTTFCKSCARAWVASRREFLKDAAYHAYGGYQCTCCSENEPHFLTIDHVNNDGATHRKSLNKDGLYRWLEQNSYPSGFQILCMNCNHGKYRNGGVCPHKTGGTPPCP